MNIYITISKKLRTIEDGDMVHAVIDENDFEKLSEAIDKITADRAYKEYIKEDLNDL